MKSALSALIFLVCALPLVASAEAILYISPERGAYMMGQVFDAKVYADSGSSLINAAEAEISFNNEALEVVELSPEDSILESWSSGPEYSNENGTIHFAGWTKKNFKGPDGLLLTVRFKAIRNMVGNAKLVAGAILAADGQESNIITSMRSGVFKIDALESPDSALNRSSTSTATFARVPAPSFDDTPEAVSIGDHIVLKGTAEPDAKVFVWIAHGTEKENRVELLAAADGSFTYVSEEPTQQGVYHIRAAAETTDGRQSVPSDIVDVSAAPTGLVATALFGASLVFEVVPFFAILVFGGLGAAYIYHRHQVAKMHYGRHSMFDQQ